MYEDDGQLLLSLTPFIVISKNGLNYVWDKCVNALREDLCNDFRTV